MLNNTIAALTEYAVRNGLICEEDRIYSINALLERLHLDSYEAPSSVELRPVICCWFAGGVTKSSSPPCDDFSKVIDA